MDIGAPIQPHEITRLRAVAKEANDEWELEYVHATRPAVVLSLLDRIEKLCCADCSIEAIEAGGPACSGCRMGLMARYLREALAERFHLDYVTGRWAGLCGHVWTEREREDWQLNRETCPWCFMKLKIETYERMLEGAGLIEEERK